MVPKQKINKGVILAAGSGHRFGSLTQACPKVLLSVNDKVPLIRYPIEALAAAGISEISIVVGYLADRVIQVLGNGSNFGVRVQYIFNSDYSGGNAVSVYKTRDWAQGDPFVLCMGDHLIESDIIKNLLNRQTFNETLCIDYLPAQYHQLAEATKVSVDSAGCIKDIGKELVHWDALDTGVYLLTENFFLAVDETVNHRGINIEMADVIRFLISKGHRFDTCNTSGCFWIDVDTEEDLKIANENLREKDGSRL